MRLDQSSLLFTVYRILLPTAESDKPGRIGSRLDRQCIIGVHGVQQPQATTNQRRIRLIVTVRSSSPKWVAVWRVFDSRC